MGMLQMNADRFDPLRIPVVSQNRHSVGLPCTRVVANVEPTEGGGHRHLHVLANSRVCLV